MVAIEAAGSLATAEVAAALRTLRLSEFGGVMQFDAHGQVNGDMLVVQHFPGATKAQGLVQQTIVAPPSHAAAEIIFPAPSWKRRWCLKFGPGKAPDPDDDQPSSPSGGPDECSGHGTCSEAGMCDCDEGFEGDACESKEVRRQLPVWAIPLIVLGAAAAAAAAACVARLWRRARPTLRLRATGAEPKLTLPASKAHHAFMSHAWSTGQDASHVIVRQLQQLLPHIRIWLDVQLARFELEIS